MDIRFSIKTKIFFVILIPALMLLFVIYQDYRHLSSLGRSAERILSKNYRSIQTAQQIRQLLEANRNYILTIMFQDRKEGVQDLALNRNIPSLLENLKDNITEAGEKNIIEKLFEHYKKYDPLFNDLVNTRKKRTESNEQYYGSSYEFVGRKVI